MNWFKYLEIAALISSIAFHIAILVVGCFDGDFTKIIVGTYGALLIGQGYFLGTFWSNRCLEINESWFKRCTELNNTWAEETRKRLEEKG